MSFIKVTAAIMALAALAGCGGHSGRDSGGPMRGTLMAPKQIDPATYRAPGVPAQFGDTKPHPWQEVHPAMLPVHGIDAARYQGRIDWPKARSSGVNFAWLKATEGGNYIDPGFSANAPQARAAGVPVGAYHFYYFCRTPQEQANWFIRNVPRVSGDLPPVLDIEWNHQSRSCRRFPDPATVRKEISAYAAIVGAYYKTRPLVYTTPDFYADNALGQLRGVEFWLRSTAAHPSARYPGERWSFWQWTGTGVVPGVGGITDVNAFGGSTDVWYAWLKARRQ
ncbi:GH25 family lysozyme [Paenirhodobacter enshiensis]|uniref:Glycoside hydrolase n=1 Tax=Paenirhodobacter enshiensis TaxID=1105367 RepID=A0A086XSM3_9RHOB|nr:GH25 family lysozyme [Paenirhodobacter enshiensis]KFI25023.1 glycoside hydrolase [Paenirhodobacter enshiensis]